METITEVRSETKPATVQTTKLDHEKAIDEFMEADKIWKAAEEKFLSGEYLENMTGVSGPILANYHREYLENLHRLLDDRNSKLLSAQHALRSSVTLSEKQLRGPDGAPTTVVYEDFRVMSTTTRTFNAEKLLELVARKGRLEKLMSLKSVDKNGNETKALQPVYKVDYPVIHSWLKQEKLDEVLSESYEEREDTARVYGPKALAFLGERKDK